MNFRSLRYTTSCVTFYARRAYEMNHKNLMPIGLSLLGTSLKIVSSDIWASFSLTNKKLTPNIECCVSAHEICQLFSIAMLQWLSLSNRVIFVDLYLPLSIHPHQIFYIQPTFTKSTSFQWMKKANRNISIIPRTLLPV